jgi:hypothetical protein
MEGTELRVFVACRPFLALIEHVAPAPKVEDTIVAVTDLDANAIDGNVLV